MVFLSASVAHKCLILALIHLHARRSHLLLMVDRFVNPVLLRREVGQHRQSQIMRRNEAFNVCQCAVWTLRTEAKHVVEAHLLARSFITVPVVAV